MMVRGGTTTGRTMRLSDCVTGVNTRAFEMLYVKEEQTCRAEVACGALSFLC